MTSKDSIRVILVLVAFVASLGFIWDLFVNISETIKAHPVSIGIVAVVTITLLLMKRVEKND